MHTFSIDINIRTLSHVPDIWYKFALHHVKSRIKLYHARGFTVTILHCDRAFECLREDLYPIQLNLMTANSHVSKVERRIRTNMEQLRTCVHGLPFKRCIKHLVSSMVAEVPHDLNMIPSEVGVSNFLNPLSIVTGASPSDNSRLKLEFGSYAQVFKINRPSNTIKTRTLEAISVSGTGS
jgi:hypothetical protein